MDQVSEESLRRRSSSESQGRTQTTRDTLGRSDGGRRKRSTDIMDSVVGAEEGEWQEESSVRVTSTGFVPSKLKVFQRSRGRWTSPLTKTLHTHTHLGGEDK